MRNKLHIRRNDMVEVITGRSAGKRGRVLQAMPVKGKVVVEGVNMVWKHMKRSQQQQRAGRIEMEAPLDASNVMLLCQNRDCDHFDRTVRTRKHIAEDGAKSRVCVKCGHPIVPQE